MKIQLTMARHSRKQPKVAATLSNSRHVVAEGIGHGVFAYGCAIDLIGELVGMPAEHIARKLIEQDDGRQRRQRITKKIVGWQLTLLRPK